MIIDNKIKYDKLQYYITRVTIKMSTLPIITEHQCAYLTGEEIFSPRQHRMIQEENKHNLLMSMLKKS